MAIDAITSTLAVTIAGSAGGDVAPPILGPSDPGEGLRVALVTAPLPKGVWTANPNDGSIPSGDTITAGAGFILQAEATVEGATPEIPLNQIEPTNGRKPLPFAQETAARPARQPDDANAAAFAATAASGGSGQLAQVALGYLTSGPLSEPATPMAVLAFGRDRVAPPRLALLTEGMVSPQTPPPATTPVVAPPPPVIDTTIHPPVIAGVLGGGAGPRAASGPAHVRRRGRRGGHPGGARRACHPGAARGCRAGSAAGRRAHARVGGGALRTPRSPRSCPGCPPPRSPGRPGCAPPTAGR